MEMTAQLENRKQAHAEIGKKSILTEWKLTNVWNEKVVFKTPRNKLAVNVQKLCVRCNSNDLILYTYSREPWFLGSSNVDWNLPYWTSHSDLTEILTVVLSELTKIKLGFAETETSQFLKCVYIWTKRMGQSKTFSKAKICRISDKVFDNRVLYC